MEDVNLRKKRVGNSTEKRERVEKEKAKTGNHENLSKQQQETILSMMQQMQQQHWSWQNLQAMLMTQQPQQNQLSMALMEKQFKVT